MRASLYIDAKGDTMIATTLHSTAEFYKRWIMSRGAFDPKQFGVDMARDTFTDQMVDQFAEVYRDGWTIDELLLHPAEAMRFCSDIKRRFAYYDVPDDIILRCILTRRKNPND